MGVPHGLVDALRNCRRLCVLTGSGISAESGVPTFREAQTGLWARFDPHELATPEAFSRDPALVWRWYRWRRELIGKVRPNAAHRALARLADMLPDLTLITQNVDGLHQQAGSRGVIEFHGNIFQNRCFAETTLVEHADLSPEVPKCPACGAALRPGVVWFGESIPATALDAATMAVQRCDLFIAIGTSALVWPAGGFAELARENAALVVEVNPDDTPLTPIANYALRGKAGVVLPELVDCLTR